MSENFRRDIKLTFEVSKLSDNKIVRGWMKHIKLTKSLKLEFHLIGAVQLPDRQIQLDNGITLKLHPHSWNGTKMVSSSIEETYKICEMLNQMYRGEFLVDGWLTVKNGEKETLEKALREIQTAVNVLSFDAGAKLTWEPKQKWVSKGVGSSVYSDGNIENFNDLLEQIRHMPSSDITEDILRSIDWYRTGLYSPSKFNQFLSFWRCIEILIDTWNKTKHPEHYHKSGKRKFGKNIGLKNIAKTAFRILFKADPDKDKIWSDCFEKNEMS